MCYLKNVLGFLSTFISGYPVKLAMTYPIEYAKRDLRIGLTSFTINSILFLFRFYSLVDLQVTFSFNGGPHPYSITF